MIGAVLNRLVGMGLKQIYSALNNKNFFGSICLDISKACDCIDHNKLYIKLRSCGIANDVLRWFHSYFDRTQQVKICKNVVFFL